MYWALPGSLSKMKTITVGDKTLSAPQELQSMVDRVLQNKGTNADQTKLMHMLYFTLALGDDLADKEGEGAVEKIWKDSWGKMKKDLEEKTGETF